MVTKTSKSENKHCKSNWVTFHSTDLTLEMSKAIISIKGWIILGVILCFCTAYSLKKRKFALYEFFQKFKKFK